MNERQAACDAVLGTILIQDTLIVRAKRVILRNSRIFLCGAPGLFETGPALRVDKNLEARLRGRVSGIRRHRWRQMGFVGTELMRQQLAVA
jgi:hypothetical protein